MIYFHFRFWESGGITRVLSVLLAILADAVLRAVSFYFCRVLAAESCNHNLLNNQLAELRARSSTDVEVILLCPRPHVSSAGATCRCVFQETPAVFLKAGFGEPSTVWLKP